MRQKSGTSKAAADKLVKNIRRKTRQTYSAEEKIRIVFWRGSEAKKAYPRYAVVKASPKACITVGQRSFSKQESVVCRVIRRGKPLRPR